MSKILTIRKMTSDDYLNYAEWYNSDDGHLISRYYSAPDDVWWDYVSNASDASAYSVYDSNIMVAHIQCDDWEPNDVTLSIVVNPGMWGQGLGYAALKLFIDTCLKDKDTLFAHIDEDNIASIKLFEKVGFRKHIKQEGEPPLVTYAMEL